MRTKLRKCINSGNYTAVELGCNTEHPSYIYGSTISRVRRRRSIPVDHLYGSENPAPSPEIQIFFGKKASRMAHTLQLIKISINQYYLI